MGNMNITEKRLSKICSIALGENFCPNFIYEDIDFTKPSEIKEAYEIFEASADWIIYDRKTGKRLSPSKSWRKWQAAKMAAAKIGGDAEVSDNAWYHDNKAKLMGEATDKELDAKDLEKMIKNPDPKRVKSYGGTKYVDMLKSKLAKLKESTDLEEIVGTVALGTVVAVGTLAAMLGVVKGAKYMASKLGDAAQSYVDKKDLAAFRALKKSKYQDEIESIAAKFDGDTTLQSMYKSLPDWSSGTNKAAFVNNADRKKKMDQIAKHIKLKLDAEESKAFAAISKVLRSKNEEAEMEESTDLEEGKKVVASVELWNGKKMKKSFAKQSAAEAWVKKMEDNEDVRDYKMHAESADFEKTNVLTADEYDEVQDFKNFNKKDWKWNAIQRKFVRKVKVK
jgi:hypothetical protein